MNARTIKWIRCYAMGAALSIAPVGVVASSAAELIYQPIVPGFGGSPLYEDYLVGLAQLQNQHLPDNGGGGGGGGIGDISFPDISIDLGGGLGGVAPPPVIVVPTAQQPATPSN